MMLRRPTVSPYLRLVGIAIFAICQAFTSAAAADTDCIAIVSLDCSVFTAGSERSPGDDDLGGEYSGAFYEATRWLGEDIYSAGGSVLLTPQGHITSPYLGGSSNFGGTVRISALFRAQSPSGAEVTLSIANTEADCITISDANWTQVSTIVTGATNYATLTITTDAELFIKTIVVECSHSFVATPKVDRPQDFDGERFTATWSSVPGADRYLVEVSPANNAISRAATRVTAESTTNFAIIEGLDPAVDYTFTVTAFKGEYASITSSPIELIRYIAALDAPTDLAYTQNGDKVTLVWSQVADADSYHAIHYDCFTTDRDIVSSLLHEDFNGITFGTVDSPVYMGNLNDYTAQPGWTTDMAHAFAAGNYCIEGAGSLITPHFATSSSGVTTVMLTVGERYSERYLTGGTVELQLIDSHGKTISSNNISISQKTVATYSASFSLPTSIRGARLQLTYSGYATLQIDDIRINSVIPEGSYVENPVEEVITAETTCKFTLTERQEHSDMFTVIAQARTVRGNEIFTIESPESQPVEIAGITAPLDDTTGISRSATILSISAVGEAVVYDLTGRTIATVSCPAVVDIHTLAPIIVTINNRSIKI